ncbi:MAG: GumC family protein [Planctomycetota bacterium]|jgi:capsular exopolysaccharide synthesis family protein
MTAQQRTGKSEPGRGELIQSESAPELKHYLSLLRRRVWAVVTVFVVVVTLGTVHAFKSKPVYRAGAKILIEKQSPRVMNFQDVMQMEGSDRSYYNTQAALLLSRNVLERALTRPGMRELFETDSDTGQQPSLVAELRRTVSALLGSPPAAPPEPWERLRNAVEVEQVRDTHLLVVSVDSGDAKRAAQVANAVAYSFAGHHLERKKALNNEAFDFLSQQTKEQQKKLSEAENALQEFREKVKIVSLDVQDANSPVLARLGRLSQELTEAQMQRIALEAELKVVQEAVGSGAPDLMHDIDSRLSLPEVRDDPTIGAIRTSLVEAEKDVIGLSDTYGPGHPQFQAAQAKVDLLRAKLAEALKQVASSLRPQLAMLSRRERELQESHERQKELALESAKYAITYGRLQSEVNRRRRLFDVLVERMREVDLSSDYAKTNVEVVEAAEVPRMPIRPKKARSVMLSSVLGLLLGMALAFFFEHMDDTIKTPADLEERVGVPVLGFVPAMSSTQASGNGFANRGMISMIDPASSVTEAYRSIRTSLFFSAPAEETRTVVVTSGGPGDGKTTTAANLALVIAQSGKRVLLIDADLRRPRLHTVFSLRSEKGISTVLVGEARLAEAVQKPRSNGRGIENLDVLAAGPKPPNPVELLDSRAMRDMLQEAAQNYDRILIDTPPVLFVADASILGAISDGVILVVKSAKNTRSLAGRAREQLEGVNARILGGILNDVRVSRLGPYYSDYYYYGYSRYYSSYYGKESKKTKAEAA